MGITLDPTPVVEDVPFVDDVPPDVDVEAEAAETLEAEVPGIRRANRRRSQMAPIAAITKACDNRLYFGENLDVLKGADFPDNFVDLVYLDPPFNSNRIHNVLFRSPGTHEASVAQIMAFEDTWVWGEQAEDRKSVV